MIGILDLYTSSGEIFETVLIIFFLVLGLTISRWPCDSLHKYKNQPTGANSQQHNIFYYHYGKYGFQFSFSNVHKIHIVTLNSRILYIWLIVFIHNKRGRFLSLQEEKQGDSAGEWLFGNDSIKNMRFIGEILENLKSKISNLNIQYDDVFKTWDPDIRPRDINHGALLYRALNE